MTEAHQLEPIERLGGALCLDFVNTADWEGAVPMTDCLTNYADLLIWSRDVELLSEAHCFELREHAKCELHEASRVFHRAIALRSTIRGLFRAIAHDQPPTDEALHHLNAELAQALPHLTLGRLADSYVWQWSDRPDHLDEMLWPIAWSAAQLLQTPEQLDRVRECSGDECGWLFIDASRNRSRRWCDMKVCGNRAKVNRYHKRQHQSKSSKTE